MLFTRKGLLVGVSKAEEIKDGLLIPWSNFQKWDRQLKGMEGAILNYAKNEETVKLSLKNGGVSVESSTGETFLFVVDREKDDAEG